MIINSSTLVLAVISIILILKYISEISTMYKQLRLKFVELDNKNEIDKVNSKYHNIDIEEDN